MSESSDIITTYQYVKQCPQTLSGESVRGDFFSGESVSGHFFQGESVRGHFFSEEHFPLKVTMDTVSGFLDGALLFTYWRMTAQSNTGSTLGRDAMLLYRLS